MIGIRTKNVMLLTAVFSLFATELLAEVGPLNLYQLDAFEQQQGCVARNGGADACEEPNSRWDKDLSKELDARDLELAIREYWDDRALDYICYQKFESPTYREISDLSECNGDCIVFPHSLCGSEAAACLQEHTPEACEDVDGDGLRKYEEDALGTSDREYNADCTGNAAVCGFEMSCDNDGAGASNRCLPRDCPTSGCTAFHLETVSVNNNELIIHVHYDYSPVDATILDLYLDYNYKFLNLIYSRLLTVQDVNLAKEKELHVTQQLDGRLRLTILSRGAETPIPTGAIVELVFNRISSAQTSVGFTTQDHLQVEAMAPKQGEDQNGVSMTERLAEDRLWGDAVQIPAADPNGPRLLLYYSFDNFTDLRDYEDVKTGDELCELTRECGLLDDSDPLERTERDKLEARLNNLQKGSERVTEAIDGVIGPGVYLDGKTDHLKLPITVDDPAMDLDGRYYYQKRAQSFSLSTWFYAEADDSLDQTPYGQVLFSRNTNEERTRFGLAVRRPVDDPSSRNFDLVWFQGLVSDRDELIDSSISQVVVWRDLPVRVWTYIGMAVTDTLQGVDDDGDGEIDEADEFDRVSFFVNGEKATWTFPASSGPTDDIPMAPNVPEGVMPFLNSGRQYELGDVYKMQCPYPADSGGLYLHEEGVDVGVVGGSGSPEVVMFASSENNLFGIEQMDLNGFERTEILRDGVSSAKDVDYSPLLNKMVYSSSKSGNYEIWIANGDGSNARQITKGFGDTSRKIFARRPKWAPDGSAIVFDSNVYSIPYDDNWYARSYNIYYIQYDAKKNEVKIPLSDGGTMTELDYDVLATNQIVQDYRVSGTDTHSFGAIWARKGESGDRGVIWFNRTNTKFKQKEIVAVQIPDRINSSKEEVPAALGTCDGDPADRDDSDDEEGMTDEELFAKQNVEECTPVAPEYKILDAYHIQPIAAAGAPVQSEMLYLKEWITYDEEGAVSLSAPAERTNATNAPSPYYGVMHWDGRKVTVDVMYDPLAHHFGELESRCWDDDADGFDDADENKYDPEGTGWDWMDCTAFEIPGLYLAYNQQAVTAFPDASTPAAWVVDSTEAGGLGKEMQIEESHTLCGDYVKVRVTSPINNLRIFNQNMASNERVLARLEFSVPDCAEVDVNGDGDLNDSGVDITQMPGCQPIARGDDPIPTPGFALQIRNTNQELRITDLSGPTAKSGKFLIQDNALEFVTGAEFSPDGNRVILTGIQKSRPVMLVSKKPPANYDPTEESNHHPYGLSFNRWTPGASSEDWATWELMLDEPTCSVGPILFDKISTAPMNVEGMDWTRIQRYYPCNWVGAHKDRETKIFTNAFRGGLDELRLYSYPREDEAFMSDYQRGQEWLEKEGREDEQKERVSDCESDLECPPYKICDAGRCEIKACNPDDASACQSCDADGRNCQPQGVCTLMPVPNQLGEDPESFEWDTDTETPESNDEMRWVCSVECATDRQCFREECLNGPCRFCADDTKSCIECEQIQEKVTDDITLEYIDGCPDRNSFACEAGSCVTECYAFENGESIYLCDPSIEYCNQGRCKLFDWDWTDIAPMSTMGLGETAYDMASLRITTAIPQMYPVVIKAYGVEDYLRPPELLVEGRNTRPGTNPFGESWFKIGQVQVYNKNATEAEQHQYVLYTPAQVEDIRLRLILPSYDNLTASARGYNDWEGDHGCKDGACRTCDNWIIEYDDDNDEMGELENRCPLAHHCDNEGWKGEGSCTWRASGSRSIMGYPIGITEQEQRKFCQDHERSSNCRYQQNLDIDKYLWGGNPAVAILSVSVAGKSGSITSNRFCPYYMEQREIAIDDEPDEIPGEPLLVTPFSKILRVVTDEEVTAITASPMSTERFNEGLETEFVSQKANYRVFGVPDKEQSPQRTMLDRYQGVPIDLPNGNALVQANCTEHDDCYDDGSGIGDDWAMLNCNVFETEGVNAENLQATAEYQICSGPGCDTIYPVRAQVGAIQEDASGCSIVRGMRREPCYEWIGNDVSMDFMAFMDGAKQPWFTLDFDYYRGFGYDNRSLSEK